MNEGEKGREEPLEQAALVSGAGLESLVEEAEELDVSDEAPWGLVDETGRDFANEALDAEGRAEAFQHVNEEVEVFVQGKACKLLRASGIFLLHPSAFNYLQLMKFHRTERKPIDDGA